MNLDDWAFTRALRASMAGMADGVFRLNKPPRYVSRPAVQPSDQPAAEHVAVDPESGLSMRFVKAWDIKADLASLRIAEDQTQRPFITLRFMAMEAMRIWQNTCRTYGRSTAWALTLAVPEEHAWSRVEDEFAIAALAGRDEPVYLELTAAQYRVLHAETMDRAREAIQDLVLVVFERVYSIQGWRAALRGGGE